MTFVGYRIWPNCRKLKKSNIRVFRRRVCWMKWAYANQYLGWKDVESRLNSWMGYVKHADAKFLVKQLSRQWIFKRDRVESASCCIRGGNWNNNTTNCAVTYRNNNTPTNRNNNIGFRFVMHFQRDMIFLPGITKFKDSASVA